MPTLSELLEAGAHFGHKKERSYPRAKKFTYTIRDSVFVIDLEQTIGGFKQAIENLTKIFKENKTVLFVGTKRQARQIVKKTAENLGMPYIVERWLGGMLTNFETIRKNLKKLDDLEKLTKSEDFVKLTKNERKRIEEKLAKMIAIFGGIRKMTKLPDALFIVDTAKEDVAVGEARKMSIPIFGICDTNANPDLIDWPIPANDDSEKTISLILSKIEENLKNQQKSIPKDQKIVEEKEIKQKSEPRPKDDEKKSTKLRSVSGGKGRKK